MRFVLKKFNKKRKTKVLERISLLYLYILRKIIQIVEKYTPVNLLDFLKKIKN